MRWLLTIVLAALSAGVSSASVPCPVYLRAITVGNLNGARYSFKKKPRIAVRCNHGVGCSPILKVQVLSELAKKSVSNFEVNSAGLEALGDVRKNEMTDAEFFIDLANSDYYLTIDPHSVGLASEMKRKLKEEPGYRKHLRASVAKASLRENGGEYSDPFEFLRRKAEALEYIDAGNNLENVNVVSVKQFDLYEILSGKKPTKSSFGQFIWDREQQSGNIVETPPR